MEGRSETSISDMDALKLNDVWDKKWVIAAKENEKGLWRTEKATKGL